MNNNLLRDKLARFGYRPPESETVYDAAPIEPLDTHPGTTAAITADAQADKIEQRVAVLREAAELCASDSDWFAVFEAFVGEAMGDV